MGDVEYKIIDEFVRTGQHYLYVDIECTDCGKLMALSNAVRRGHKYLCQRCAEKYPTPDWKDLL